MMTTDNDLKNILAFIETRRHLANEAIERNSVKSIGTREYLEAFGYGADHGSLFELDVLKLYIQTELSNDDTTQ